MILEDLPKLDSEYEVNSDSVEAYRRDGHTVVRGIASKEEISAYRPFIRVVVEETLRRNDSQGRIDDYSKLFMQVTNVWRLSEAARRMIFSRRFAGVAARLLGVPAVRLYHDQALFKPPGAARTPWHQDRYYWPLDTDLTVTLWLPLNGVEERMGPMRFATGSHRGGNRGDLAISEAVDNRLAQLIEERGWPVASPSLAVGDATFHAGGTIHSAGANKSASMREILTIIYYAAGTCVATPQNDNQRADLQAFFPGKSPGEVANTALNPMLYP